MKHNNNLSFQLHPAHKNSPPSTITRFPRKVADEQKTENATNHQVTHQDTFVATKPTTQPVVPTKKPAPWLPILGGVLGTGILVVGLVKHKEIGEWFQTLGNKKSFSTPSVNSYSNESTKPIVPKTGSSNSNTPINPTSPLNPTPPSTVEPAFQQWKAQMETQANQWLADLSPSNQKETIIKEVILALIEKLPSELWKQDTDYFLNDLNTQGLWDATTTEALTEAKTLYENKMKNQFQEFTLHPIGIIGKLKSKRVEPSDPLQHTTTIHTVLETVFKQQEGLLQGRFDSATLLKNIEATEQSRYLQVLNQLKTQTKQTLSDHYQEQPIELQTDIVDALQEIDSVLLTIWKPDMFTTPLDESNPTHQLAITIMGKALEKTEWGQLFLKKQSIFEKELPVIQAILATTPEEKVESWKMLTKNLSLKDNAWLTPVLPFAEADRDYLNQVRFNLAQATYNAIEKGEPTLLKGGALPENLANNPTLLREFTDKIDLLSFDIRENYNTSFANKKAFSFTLSDNTTYTLTNLKQNAEDGDTAGVYKHVFKLCDSANNTFLFAVDKQPWRNLTVEKHSLFEHLAIEHLADQQTVYNVPKPVLANTNPQFSWRISNFVKSTEPPQQTVGSISFDEFLDTNHMRRADINTGMNRGDWAVDFGDTELVHGFWGIDNFSCTNSELIKSNVDAIATYLTQQAEQHGLNWFDAAQNHLVAHNNPHNLALAETIKRYPDLTSHYYLMLLKDATDMDGNQRINLPNEALKEFLKTPVGRIVYNSLVGNEINLLKKLNVISSTYENDTQHFMEQLGITITPPQKT